MCTSLPDLLANRFEVHEPIGQGGMGIVYGGVDRLTGRAVAIKTLRADAADWQPTAFDRFQREAELLRQLNHPNIIETIATFAHAERTYIVMEYAEGGSLAWKLKREHPMSMNAVASIALDVADAMTLEWMSAAEAIALLTPASHRWAVGEWFASGAPMAPVEIRSPAEPLER